MKAIVKEHLAIPLEDLQDQNCLGCGAELLIGMSFDQANDEVSCPHCGQDMVVAIDCNSPDYGPYIVLEAQ